MHDDEDNALKDQGNRQGFTAAPLNAMECETVRVAPQLGDRVQIEADDFINIFLLRIDLLYVSA
jgi:hypothetical protein